MVNATISKVAVRKGGGENNWYIIDHILQLKRVSGPLASLAEFLYNCYIYDFKTQFMPIETHNRKVDRIIVLTISFSLFTVTDRG